MWTLKKYTLTFFFFWENCLKIQTMKGCFSVGKVTLSALSTTLTRNDPCHHSQHVGQKKQMKRHTQKMVSRIGHLDNRWDAVLMGRKAPGGIVPTAHCSVCWVASRWQGHREPQSLHWTATPKWWKCRLTFQFPSWEHSFRNMFQVLVLHLPDDLFLSMHVH